MTVDLSHLTFRPDEETAAAVRAAWRWLTPDDATPILCSILGDVFLGRANGAVLWLDTGRGKLEPAADNAEQFHAALASDQAVEWLIPPLVESARSAGKIPGPGQCYGFKILPIFAEGRYEAGNLAVITASEYLSFTGDTHHQIASIPDGQKVEIKLQPPPALT
jgi:hypothetical protein